MALNANIGIVHYHCGVMVDSQPGLRERARRAIQKEITEAAQQLFVDRGYEATTIDDIAEAAGLSRRSVFRYFSSKEDIIVGKFAFIGETIVAILRDRPLDEAVWRSLRLGLDVLVPYVDDPDKQDMAESMQRIVFASPALLASYLEKLERIQIACDHVLRDRAAARGAPVAPADPRPRAVVGAAFSCLLAAQHSWLADSGRQAFAACLDAAMTALAPVEPQPDS
ncbi:TetR family transcriptional regulator [Planotetraspora thailandica]|uniref:TetR family transcriptional regulator n=1 Tax=Planotetraspora thailandica TaxID=487172 RepID=A0A8J3XWM3_9ACTN|nr:TetR/AcrR family transcriptional regulator [Planotetraspora thailandica]GII51873.1 TetR family transcriptional regulator [Planotetraspora thailandica]